MCGLAGQTGVWAAPDAAPWLWAVLLGTAQGASFAIGMVLLVRYAVSPAAAARFTAMAFLFSYTVASLGPTTMGAVRDLSGGYSAIWLVLAVLMARHVGPLPVHFVGKSGTFALLYAFPLLLLAQWDGPVGVVAGVVGWAFAWWGMGLYWLAAAIYVRQAVTELRRRGRGAP